MAFTCGFFNSENGDRKYNAEQMSAIFDGIIADGVFTTIGDHLAVSAGTGMQVLVGTGKAWFDHTWNVNDAVYPLAIAASDVTLSRIDAIVLETNHSDSVRLNKLRVVQGTVASSPVKPTLTNSEKVHQHPLAWVTVKPGVTQIAASAIENAVGTSACPFVTGIIATTSIDDLFNQWNGEFDEWFDNLKAQLSDNVVANLQKQIDEAKTAKHTIINSEVAALLKIAKGSNVDEAFLALGIGANYYGYRIKVKLADGAPAKGSTVTGISALPGLSLVTGEDGIVVGRSLNPSVTISCTSPYIDQKAPAAQTVTKTGTITDVTLTLESIADMLTISSSTTAKISSMTKTVDIFASGGGGGGGGGPEAGGGGGYASNKLNEPISGDTDLKIIIGAGGNGGTSTSQNGGNGGETTVSLNNVTALTASGGFGGTTTAAGAGNGPGGTKGVTEAGVNGSPASVPVFNDSSIGIKTGGGGGGGTGPNVMDGSHSYGGAPNGGDGGYRLYWISQGSHNEYHDGGNGGIGGGGGGGTSGDYIHNGGNGGPGIVYLRFHFDAV